MSETSTTLATIKADWTAARRLRESDRAAYLGTLYSDAFNKGRNDTPPRESTEAEVQGVVKSTVDKLRELRTEILKQAEPDPARVAKVDAEIADLERYQPKMLDEDGIRAALATYKAENPYGEDAPGASMRSMKSMMRYLSETHPGAYDGQVASKIAREVITAAA